VAYGPKQKQARLYRGQIPSPGRPTVAWREDRVRFWAAIARGEKTEEACAAAGVSSPVGFRWFRHAGGVKPCLPPVVSGRYLSFSEREDIALLRAQGGGVREIARRVGRSPSTISRELRRNASTRTYHLDYKASVAQWHAERRARRPKAAKLAGNERLRDYVQQRLAGAVCDAGAHIADSARRASMSITAVNVRRSSGSGRDCCRHAIERERPLGGLRRACGRMAVACEPDVAAGGMRSDSAVAVV